MPQFPSLEWMKQFREAVNASPAYAEAAKDWEGDFVFVIEPDATFKETKYYWVDLWHGKCRDVQELSDLSQKKAEFEYKGPYGNWKKLIKKELDPIQSLMTGKFKLKGNMAKVMRATRAAQELVNSVTKVETEFAA
ncbi:MAG: SCP2 sterol-binding domain-containing protein [Methanobacteriota archaeon]